MITIDKNWTIFNAKCSRKKIKNVSKIKYVKYAEQKNLPLESRKCEFLSVDGEDILLIDNDSYCIRSESDYKIPGIVEYLQETFPPEVIHELSIESRIKDYIFSLTANKETLEELCEFLVEFFTCYYNRNIINGKTGSIILAGEPGDGKTYLATQIFTICNRFGLPICRDEELTFGKASKMSPNFYALIDDANFDHFSRSNGAGSVCSNILSEMNRPSCFRCFLITTNEDPNDKQIDPAFFRPGRIEKIIYVRKPNRDTIFSYFKKTIPEKYFDENVCHGFTMMSEENNFSFAQLSKLMQLYLTDSLLNKTNGMLVEDYIKKVKDLPRHQGVGTCQMSF